LELYNCKFSTIKTGYMKVIIKNIFLLFFLFSASVFAQQNRWLDANLKETDQLNSVYYTIISSDASEENYFYKSGKIFRKFKYSSQKLSPNFSAKFSEFYETGALKVSGKYENGFKEGIWKTYYKNGKMKERGKYKSGEKVGIWKAFYKKL